MDILLVTLGSAGDVHPFIALGNEFRRRGHRITLVTNGYFKPLAEQFGFHFHALGDEKQFQSVIANPDIWHPGKGLQILIRELILDRIEATYEIISQLRNDKTMVVATGQMFGARIAQEKWRLPLVTIHLQPAALWSCEEPAMLGFPLPLWMPKFITQVVMRGIENFIVDRLLAPKTNQFRKSLGLSPVKQICSQWLHSPQQVIGLFPDWFCAKASDWPQQLDLSGFVSHEDDDGSKISGAVGDFLKAGEKPIVFTPGSAMQHGTLFFHEAAKACAILGVRGIFLSKFDSHIPAELPHNIAHFDYVPLSHLLPQAAALVHHGGIGTTAKALASGIPQLIMPMAFDQPDNAARLKRLGVADILPPKRFNGANLAKMLENLLLSKQIQSQCATISRKIDFSDSVRQTCSLILEPSVGAV